MYDMAKGLHVLAYQCAIEGIGLILSEAWNKFNDSKVPEKQKLGYLTLAKNCHESMINLTEDGPAIMGIQHMAAKAKRLGITTKFPPLPNPESLTEEQLTEDYRKLGEKGGRGYIPYDGVGVEGEDINNPEGLPDTTDPNDFRSEPELMRCIRRYGDYSYSHIRHKPGEYCYLRDKEEKEKAAKESGWPKSIDDEERDDNDNIDNNESNPN